MGPSLFDLNIKNPTWENLYVIFREAGNIL